MVPTELPAWLQRRVAYDNNSTTAQDIQSGANLYQQSQQNQRQAQQFALQQEAMRLKLEGQRFITAGAIELGQLMEEGGTKNLYADSAFEGKLWSLGQKYPQLLDSDVFQGAARVVEHAKTAKAKAELTDLTQAAITDRNAANIDSRFNLLTQRLDGMMQMEGVRQEGRTALEQMRGEVNLLRDHLKGGMASDLEAQRQTGRTDLETQRQTGRVDLQGARDDASMDRLRQSLENSLLLQDEKSADAKELRQLQNQLDIDRDQKKPRTLRPDRFVLDRDDEMKMSHELEMLKQWRKSNRGVKHDAEYDRKYKEIEDKFESRRKTPATPAPTASGAPSAPPPADQRKAGTVYQTPKGPYKWTGSGWEAP